MNEWRIMKNPTACFLTYDFTLGSKPIEPNGCAWYRNYLPMKELEEAGWDSGIGFPGWNVEHGFGLLVPDNKAIHGWDIIVFKLIMLQSIAEKMEHAKEMGQKIVVDIDDWFEGLEKTNMAYTMTDPEKNPKNNRDHYLYIIENADAIITSTPFLHDFYKKEKGMKNVFMVRNGIDLPRWKQRKDYSRGLPKLGWVGATPWRSLDLETMRHWFGNFLESNHLSFHHSGHIINAKEASHQLGIPKSVKVTKDPMQKISKYPELFRKIDIGLVPLSDAKFNHAKSGIKGLEYSAAGVPLIASYSPEYAMLEDQGIGRVARNSREWMGHLEELLDPRVRKEDVEKNLDNIKTYQTMEVRRNDWNTVMHQIRDL